MKKIIIALSFLSYLFSIDVTSGGGLSKNQQGIDIIHYDIRLKVDAKRKMISGYIDIKIKVIDEIRFIELDLLKDYFISKVKIDGVTTPFKHRANKIFVKAQDIELNKTIVVTVDYKGKPPIAENPPWSGGFTWTKSQDGYPWVGVSCQANGSYLWYPSKEHPSDEPEGADIHITVTKPLSVASNGVLQKVTDLKNKWHTWHWKTNYNINPYNINFTVGNFEIVERIIPSLEKPLNTQFFVLGENREGADKLLDHAEMYIDFFTRSFGQYPWLKEKLGIVNTPYLGMEHQTIIAYGNDYKYNDKGYDFLLFHELAHEWWGNYLSVGDWADFWIHEGFAIYSEALFVEEKHGLNEYNNFFKKNLLQKIPLNRPVVLDRNSTMKQIMGLDPYYKGAYVLHMLRYVIGDDYFFKIIDEFLHSKKQSPNNQVSTSDFINIVNKTIDANIDWFFQVYLYENKYPVLNKKIKHGSNHTFVELFWENKGFSMPIEVFYKSNTGFTEKRLALTNEPTMIAIPQYNNIKIDPDKRVLLTLNKID
jgi:aminopeptidase N